MSDPTSWASLLRVFAGLVLVLGIFFFVLRVLKRTQPGLVGGRADFRVVASLMVSARERLLLLQVGEQQILVGTGPQGLRTLHVLPQPLGPQKSEASPAFADWLRRATSRNEREERSP